MTYCSNEAPLDQMTLEWSACIRCTYDPPRLNDRAETL